MGNLTLFEARQLSALARLEFMSRQASIYASYRKWDQIDPRKGYHYNGCYFGWRSLAGVRQPCNVVPDLPPYCDHSWYFKIGRVPTAIVTFPYHYKQDECEEFAQENGLIFDNEDEFPNWYGHGTFMIVWTRSIMADIKV